MAPRSFAPPKRRLEIDTYHPTPVFERMVRDEIVRVDPSIVDQNVQVPECCEHIGDRTINVLITLEIRG